MNISLEKSINSLPFPLTANQKLNDQSSQAAAERKAAKDIETMLFTQLLKSMFNGVENSSLWGQGHSSDMIKPMWIEAMAQSCTKNDDVLGIAKKICKKNKSMSAISKVNKEGEAYNVSI